MTLGPLRLDLQVPASVNVQALVLSALAAVCLFRLRLGVVRTPGVAAAAGLALRVLLG